MLQDLRQMIQNPPEAAAMDPTAHLQVAIDKIKQSSAANIAGRLVGSAISPWNEVVTFISRIFIIVVIIYYLFSACCMPRRAAPALEPNEEEPNEEEPNEEEPNEEAPYEERPDDEGDPELAMSEGAFLFYAPARHQARAETTNSAVPARTQHTHYRRPIVEEGDESALPQSPQPGPSERQENQVRMEAPFRRGQNSRNARLRELDKLREQSKEVLEAKLQVLVRGREYLEGAQTQVDVLGRNAREMLNNMEATFTREYKQMQRKLEALEMEKQTIQEEAERARAAYEAEIRRPAAKLAVSKIKYLETKPKQNELGVCWKLCVDVRRFTREVYKANDINVVRIMAAEFRRDSSAILYGDEPLTPLAEPSSWLPSGEGSPSDQENPPDDGTSSSDNIGNTPPSSNPGSPHREGDDGNDASPNAQPNDGAPPSDNNSGGPCNAGSPGDKDPSGNDTAPDDKKQPKDETPPPNDNGGPSNNTGSPINKDPSDNAKTLDDKKQPDDETPPKGEGSSDKGKEPVRE